MTDGVDFATIEREHVGRRLYPDFTWHAYNAFSPVNPLPLPLPAAKVAFVTTAGVHLREQIAFDSDAKAGDPTFREVPVETPLAELELTHGGYDTERARVDLNVVLPLDHLRALVDEGQIGSLAPTIYSFMGYVADVAPLLHESGPAVAERLRKDGADLVLLAPT